MSPPPMTKSNANTSPRMRTTQKESLFLGTRKEGNSEVKAKDPNGDTRNAEATTADTGT